MITIFKDKKDIPSDKEYVELNDVFFNQKTVSRIDDKASAIVEKIDASKLIGKYKMESKFNGVTLDIDCLSIFPRQGFLPEGMWRKCFGSIVWTKSWSSI